jgi:hypothetical protein
VRRERRRAVSGGAPAAVAPAAAAPAAAPPATARAAWPRDLGRAALAAAVLSVAGFPWGAWWAAIVAGALLWPVLARAPARRGAVLASVALLPVPAFGYEGLRVYDPPAWWVVTLGVAAAYGSFGGLAAAVGARIWPAAGLAWRPLVWLWAWFGLDLLLGHGSGWPLPFPVTPGYALIGGPYAVLAALGGAAGLGLVWAVLGCAGLDLGEPRSVGVVQLPGATVLPVAGSDQPLAADAERLLAYAARAEGLAADLHVWPEAAFGTARWRRPRAARAWSRGRSARRCWRVRSGAATTVAGATPWRAGGRHHGAVRGRQALVGARLRGLADARDRRALAAAGGRLAPGGADLLGVALPRRGDRSRAPGRGRPGGRGARRLGERHRHAVVACARGSARRLVGGRPVVVASHDGPSMVWGHDGRLLAVAGPGPADLVARVAAPIGLADAVRGGSGRRASRRCGLRSWWRGSARRGAQARRAARGLVRGAAPRAPHAA